MIASASAPTGYPQPVCLAAYGRCGRWRLKSMRELKPKPDGVMVYQETYHEACTPNTI